MRHCARPVDNRRELVDDPRRGKNMFVLGILCQLYGLDAGLAREQIARIFRKKDESVIQSNLALYEAGAAWAEHAGAPGTDQTVTYKPDVTFTLRTSISGGKLVFIILPLVRPTLLNLVVLSFIGKMKIFDLVWITTKANPLWSAETVSTYVYKRAFEWSTFDLGYPSTIAIVWFAIVMIAVLALTRAFRVRDKLEY